MRSARARAARCMRMPAPARGARSYVQLSQAGTYGAIRLVVSRYHAAGGIFMNKLRNRSTTIGYNKLEYHRLRGAGITGIPYLTNIIGQPGVHRLLEGPRIQPYSRRVPGAIGTAGYL
eukprot:SAG31_NODE_62_length_28678_cov_21.548270_21_plen_118_part_00